MVVQLNEALLKAEQLQFLGDTGRKGLDDPQWENGTGGPRSFQPKMNRIE